MDIFEDLWQNEYLTQFDQWDEEGNRVDAYTLGIAMMLGYEEAYGDDDHIEVIQPEQGFQVDVYDAAGNYLATLVGRFDAIIFNHRTQRYMIFEHKTGKSISFVRVNSKYGEQGLSYWWAAQHWLASEGRTDYALDGVLYNWLRKALPDDRPRNAQGHYLNKPSKAALVARADAEGLPSKGTVDVLTDRLTAAGVDVALLGEPSKSQPPPLFDRQELLLTPDNLRTFERRLRNELYEMDKVRQRKLPILKTPGMACDWCSFKDVCELHEMGGDWRDMIDMDFKPWDPYSDHELEAEKA